MEATVTVLPGSSPSSVWALELAELLERAPRGEALTGTSDRELIDLIAALERGKGALGASQAHAEVIFRESQIASQRRQGVSRGQIGKGVADQIALARRITPKQASDQLVIHQILIETLPRTTRLLEKGEISEWAAGEVAKNVLVLSDEDRELIDQELEGRLPTMTASASGRSARARAQELDPEAAVKRAARAVADRRVSLRPAPDGMSILHAVLPTKAGVACFKALTLESKSAKSDGDPRGKGQIMADTLVERVTGLETVDNIPVEINLLMTDATLLGTDDGSGWLEGFPIPGRTARDIALGVETGLPREPLGGFDAPDASSARPGDASPALGEEEILPNAAAPPGAMSGAAPPRAIQPAPFGDPPGSNADPHLERRVLQDAKRWIRRLYTDPHTGELTAADPRRRLFRGAVRRFILLRDQRCRTPWCDAAIHDVDHSTRYSDGGETTIDNGIGYCQRFNLVRELPGWETSIEPAEEGKPARLLIVTPAGHRYSSSAPALVDPVLAEEQGRAAGDPTPGAAIPGGPAAGIVTADALTAETTAAYASPAGTGTGTGTGAGTEPDPDTGMNMDTVSDSDSDSDLCTVADADGEGDLGEASARAS